MNEIDNIKQTWYCCDCLCSIFSFNCIDDTIELLLYINQWSGFRLYHSNIQCLSYIHLSLNDYDHQCNTFDANPDLNHFKSFIQYIINCTYFLESEFIIEMSKSYQMKENVCLCHLNIRSMSKNIKILLAITLIWLAIGLPYWPLQKPGWNMLIVICLVSLVIACWKNIDQVGKVVE